MFTFAQTSFDQHHDYIERDDDNKVIGMWADYYSDINLPTENEPIPEPTVSGAYAEITYAGSEPHVKVNGSYKKITITYYDTVEEIIDQTPGEWLYLMDDIDVSDLVKVLETDSPNVIKVKFIGGEEYLDRVLTIKNIRQDVTAELQLQIVSL